MMTLMVNFQVCGVHYVRRGSLILVTIHDIKENVASHHDLAVSTAPTGAIGSKTYKSIKSIVMVMLSCWNRGQFRMSGLPVGLILVGSFYFLIHLTQLYLHPPLFIFYNVYYKESYHLTGYSIPVIRSRHITSNSGYRALELKFLCQNGSWNSHRFFPCVL